MSKVRVYKDYDPIRVLRAIDESKFDSVAAKANLVGLYEELDESDLQGNRENRNEWELSNGKVKDNPVKVAAKKAKQDKKDKDAQDGKDKLEALGLTEAELAALGL